jgi:uncharacterized membrane protein
VFPSDNDDDLWINAETDKTVVYEQEPLLLSYKVYSTVDIIQLSANQPDLKGFLIVEPEQNERGQFKKEKKDGKEYKTVVWSQYVLYPQTTGTLEIPNVDFSGTVVKEKHSNDPIQDFFDGNDGFEEVEEVFHSTNCSVMVKPLPDKPSDFSGGVGSFSIVQSLDKSQVNGDEPVTLRIIISGTGNFKLLKTPKLKLSSNFETYDPNVIDSLTITVKGYEGKRFYDFVIVPHSWGKYTIPPAELTYFDVTDKTYKTIKTEPLALMVNKGDRTENSSDTLKVKKEENHSFIRSVLSGTYIFVLLGAIALILCAVFLFRRYKKVKRNKVIQREKMEMAANVAEERLRKAKLLIQEDKHEEFYDEILHTLWEYMANRLKMPSVDLSAEKIQARLESMNLDNHTIELFTSAINECEYERYAPGDSAGNMRKTYDSAYNAILEIESAYRGSSLKKVRFLSVRTI